MGEGVEGKRTVSMEHGEASGSELLPGLIGPSSGTCEQPQLAGHRGEQPGAARVKWAAVSAGHSELSHRHCRCLREEVWWHGELLGTRLPASWACRETLSLLKHKDL